MTRALTGAVAAFVMCVAFAGCASDDDGDAAPVLVVQPSVVPAAADLIESETTIGDLTAGGEERRLSNFSCADDLVTVATTVETIYAELPCDRFITPEQAEQFRDVALRISVRPDAEGLSKLIMQSDTQYSIEFTIGHAWIDEP